MQEARTLSPGVYGASLETDPLCALGRGGILRLSGRKGVSDGGIPTRVPDSDYVWKKEGTDIGSLPFRRISDSAERSEYANVPEADTRVLLQLWESGSLRT